MEKFYITTPLYYVNSKLHIGHTYTTVFSDVLNRFHKMRGVDTFFLTGSDEHGQKIFEAAKAAGKSPQALADENVQYFKELWKLLNVDYDKFIRTTDAEHEKRVGMILQKLYDKGYIYSGKYEAYHCVPCESFWNEKQLEEGKCPSCGGEVNWVDEENYFFSMSKFLPVLQKKLAEDPGLIKPRLRYKEIMGKIKDSMEDKSVSRAHFDWGIKLPFDPEQVCYVWFDAIMNYITAIGYPENMEEFNRFWPSDLHVIGKDILWFHTLFWYSILEALDLPLPTVYAHGFWLMKGGKMSKRSGMVIDPFELADKYGIDSLRYFLVSGLPEGLDTEFSEQRLIEKFNNELVNIVSNTLHRTLTMLEKYLDGKLLDEIEYGEMEEALKAKFTQYHEEYESAFTQMRLPKAIGAVIDYLREVNAYINDAAPFRTGKNDLKRTSAILYTVLESLRLTAIMLYPVIPDTADKILNKLKYKWDFTSDGHLEWGRLKTDELLEKGEPIFMRLKEE
ncbi:methionine--tRNA ligase [bacterium]|nr:methionine--tRNA ligase [bacterium]